MVSTRAFLLASGLPVSIQPSAPAGPAQRWDQRYDRETYVYGEEPVVFLAEQIERLRKGKALVLAAGEGRNAVYLAQQGFQVVAVDISAKGLEKAAHWPKAAAL